MLKQYNDSMNHVAGCSMDGADFFSASYYDDFVCIGSKEISKIVAISVESV